MVGGRGQQQEVGRPPVGEPEGMPETTPEEAHINHTVHSSTTIALTSVNPEAICLSLVTVWLHTFIRVFAWLHCDAGMNSVIAQTELHPMHLSRLVISCCRLSSGWPSMLPKMPAMVNALEPLSKGEPVPTFECENFMTDQRYVNVTILSD